MKNVTKKNKNKKEGSIPRQSNFDFLNIFGGSKKPKTGRDRGNSIMIIPMLETSITDGVITYNTSDPIQEPRELLHTPEDSILFSSGRVPFHDCFNLFYEPFKDPKQQEINHIFSIELSTYLYLNDTSPQRIKIGKK